MRKGKATAIDLMAPGASLAPDRVSQWRAPTATGTESIVVEKASAAEVAAYAVPGHALEPDAVVGQEVRGLV